MKYTLSQDYIARKRRNALLTVALYTAAALGSAITGLYSEVYALLLGLIFLVFSWKAYPTIKYWPEHGPKISVEISNGEIIYGYSDRKATQALDGLSQLIVQKRGKRLQSLLLKFDSQHRHKLEGFEGLEKLAEEVEAVIGNDKVKEAQWLHR